MKTFAFRSRHAPHLAALGLLIAASGAQANTAADAAEQRFDNRQARQEQRIEQGATSGSLTPREARRLQRQQAGLQRAENRAGADGTLTRGEALRLENRQDRTSRHIYRQKHDRQARP